MRKRGGGRWRCEERAGGWGWQGLGMTVFMGLTLLILRPQSSHSATARAGVSIHSGADAGMSAGGVLWGRMGVDAQKVETPPPAEKPMSVADQIAKVGQESRVVARVTIEDVLLGHTTPSFACATMDWWPRSKCDYGTCSWGAAGPAVTMPAVNLSHPVLRAAVRSLTSELSAYTLLLRVGGTLSDYVYYQTDPTDDTNCHTFTIDETSRTGYTQLPICMGMETWHGLFDFCHTARCRVVFSVNALHGRARVPCETPTHCHDRVAPACCTEWQGTWSSDNLRSLLEYSKDASMRPFALQFGNELCGPRGIGAHLDVEEYQKDFQRFAAVVKSVWPEKETSPLLVAVSTGYQPEWLAGFLGKNVGADAVAHHLYSLGSAIDERAYDKMFNASHLQRVTALAAKVRKTVKEASPNMQLWVGEAGGAFNSGRQDITGCFASSFWYLDEMATMAAHGHQVYCRQTLLGGNYGLLDSQRDLEPNPDYYALMLWRQLMGARVLLAVPDVNHPHLRVFAQCTHKSMGMRGDVTLLLLNLHPNKTVSVDTHGAGLREKLSQHGRTEYHMTAAGATPTYGGDVRGKDVYLNGHLLKVNHTAAPNAIVPDYLLYGKHAQRDSGKPVFVGPRSYVFVLIQGAKHRHCRKTLR